MIKLNVLINTIDKIKKFVEITTKYDCDFDLVSGRYVVDGKSIMGIIALDTSKAHELRIISDDEELYENLKSDLSSMLV